MRRYITLFIALVLMLSLCACGAGEENGAENPRETEAAAQTEPPATIPPDGDPHDVTCKGSYTDEVRAASVAATAGDVQLTNAQLQVWYWAEVAQYRQSGHEIAPDFEKPLDTQPCQIDDSVASWQQYFLRNALNAWHRSQALVLQSETEQVPYDETYDPKLENYEKYLTDMPANKLIKGYSDSYSPNSMHQAYLDAIPDTLTEFAREQGYAGLDDLAASAFGTDAKSLTAAAGVLNLGYAWFTDLNYYIEPTAEDVEAYFAEHEESYAEAGITRDAGYTVDVHHILLYPEPTVQSYWANSKRVEEITDPVTVNADGTVTCSEAVWENGYKAAEKLLKTWRESRKKNYAAFAELANKQSADSGSALNGGAYRRIRPGQLRADLDEWCFNEERQVGDTTIIRSEYGYHILHFTGRTDLWYAQAEADLIAEQQKELISTACEKYPMRVEYSRITLSQAEANVSTSDLLYPDIAHQRYPEVPVFLQQDYPGVMYGWFELRTHGCGITSMAMLATYMSDDELTPPEMCERYSNYSFSTGTDGRIFEYEPSSMGFYLKERTFEPPVAKQALEDGYIVVSVQHKGYWTRGGHYIVLEDIDENGIQVRDSNIFNYGRIQAHKVDRHTWGSITASSYGYWIYEKKITSIPACSRCGNPDEIVNLPLAEDYSCEKCRPALLRRNTYLTAYEN